MGGTGKHSSMVVAKSEANSILTPARRRGLVERLKKSQKLCGCSGLLNTHAHSLRTILRMGTWVIVERHLQGKAYLGGFIRMIDGVLSEEDE